jgi:hypothetical protein
MYDVVCRICHRPFQAKRQTTQLCSNSCRKKSSLQARVRLGRPLPESYWEKTKKRFAELEREIEKLRERLREAGLGHD